MKILKTFEVNVTKHDEPNLERACDSARSLALGMLGIDEDGNSSTLKEWCRSTDSISIKFKSMTMEGGMCGWTYFYNFECMAQRPEGE